MVYNYLEEIESILLKNSDFLTEELALHPKPIFTSIDIRNAGYKIAHVDANLFPAGFNNLSSTGVEKLRSQLKKFLISNYPEAKKIAIFTEDFTRNVYYNQSINVLVCALKHIGYKVCLDKTALNTADLIILNNDLTNGIPKALQDCDKPIIPSTQLGWHSRSKYEHFISFTKLINDICLKLAVDPWLVSPINDIASDIDFRNGQGIEELAKKTDAILQRIATKYDEYNIPSKPFVCVKADNGTYGMGVMMLDNAEDLKKLNKDQRHSMQKIKHGIQNSRILIQEGIPTIESFDNMNSESMAYLCNGEILDVITRYNYFKDSRSNLNSKGMGFKVENLIQCPNIKQLIAKVAAIATQYEKLT